VYLQHGLGHAQVVLPGDELVVGEGAGQCVLALMPRRDLDGCLAVLVLARSRADPELLNLSLQRV
jgi:hypothetical protein